MTTIIIDRDMDAIYRAAGPAYARLRRGEPMPGDAELIAAAEALPEPGRGARESVLDLPIARAMWSGDRDEVLG